MNINKTRWSSQKATNLTQKDEKTKQNKKPKYLWMKMFSLILICQYINKFHKRTPHSLSK